MKYLHSTTYFPIFVLFLALDLVVGHQAKENRRDFQKFDTPSLSTLSNIGPAQWENVDEGHLGRLLIPRAGTSPFTNNS
jgi:glutaminyl-peptide cyclotransferase